MVRNVLAACEEGKEGVGGGSGGFGGGRRGGFRILPLLGDSDAVGEKVEGLRASEGGEVVLDGWLVGEHPV